EPVEDDMYLPIAAEAEAASRAIEAPSGKNLPARVEEDDRGTPLNIPNVSRAAARWIRPFVPPIVARAIDTTTQPLRAARQVFEEVEEITFPFKRPPKGTVNSEQTAESTHQTASVATDTGGNARRVESSRAAKRASLGRGGVGRPSLEHADGPGELSGSEER